MGQYLGVRFPGGSDAHWSCICWLLLLPLADSCCSCGLGACGPPFITGFVCGLEAAFLSVHTGGLSTSRPLYGRRITFGAMVRLAGSVTAASLTRGTSARQGVAPAQGGARGGHTAVTVQRRMG